MCKELSLTLVLLFISGCTSLQFNQLDGGEKEHDELLSCEKKAKAKSLQLLEQQYRCTGKK
jgi:hypothetical protein